MSSNKDIQKKISSIYNTQKITKAMEMVAISKIRKIQSSIDSSLPYFHAVSRIITNVIHSDLKCTMDYCTLRTVQRVGLIIISTNRGLCGSLNTNLFKKVIIHINKYKYKNIFCDLSILGLKGLLFFNSKKNNIIFKIKNINDQSYVNHIIKKLIIYYKTKHIDQLFIANNVFENTMLQIPKITCLLPMDSFLINKVGSPKNWDYIYEPNVSSILDKLVLRYLKSKIYQCILENFVCEQSARMVAMKTATDNSKNVIKDLQLMYNKVRQSNITQELNEIISGMSTIILD